ncbi:MAG TPA: hypothetical protein DEH25_08060, partial [Chloroflexi bacterium]|nr:hypothetical protein [Chloroflexota bacterium]
MMRKILVLLMIALNAVFIVTVVAACYLSETHPIQPGEPYFGFQDFSEQWRLRIFGDEHYALELAEQRLVDLARAEDRNRVELSAVSLGEALAEVRARIAQLPQARQAIMQENLYQLLAQADLVITALEVPSEAVTELGTTVMVMLEPSITVLAESNSAFHDSSGSPLKIDSTVIPFLGQEIDHSVYPLVGAHLTTDCFLCHTNGQYVGTYTACRDCHRLAASPPPQQDKIFLVMATSNNLAIAQVYQEHFAGECQDCHNEESWEPIAFDHEGIYECRSCHADDLPLPESEIYAQHNQYSPLCVNCHTDTEDWAEISFVHERFSECTTCHALETPENHYPGTCDRCHTDTDNWNTLVFDHTGYSDCVSCHPVAQHYTANCQVCHTSTTNWYVYNFSHAGLPDCQSCHATPQAHYGDQCNDCHSSSNWNKISFDHTNFQNCQQCHAAPVAHYPGNCTLCHQSNENDWQTVMLHVGDTDCTTCHKEDTPVNHYGNACQSCHTTPNWGIVSIDHDDFPDCNDCHLGDSPQVHYDGICSRCHNTSHWGDADFDHTSFADCLGCHLPPEKHYDGQCSNCHETNNWDNWVFDHTGFLECVDCHDEPEGHWPGECQSCHTDISDWNVYIFDHTGYDNCNACHSRPAGHPRGQCSKCHTTDTWIIASIQSPIVKIIEEVVTVECSVSAGETPFSIG